MSSIRLSVDFYNAAQQALFQNFPNWLDIQSVVQRNPAINRGDLLAYMMFREQQDADGFRTYEELRDRIEKRLGDIDDYFDFNGNQFKARFIGDDMDKDMTERVGVSLGLCVINEIHRLHEADWKRIKEVRGRKVSRKTLDFEITDIASTGQRFVQVENKGSIVANNGHKPSSVSQHYRKITEKKDYIRKEEGKKQIPPHQNLYYGAIGVVDNANIPKVWLVDPPAFEIDMTPYKYKLLARLRFYLDEFRHIGVRKVITDALEKRIEQIEAAQQPEDFNNKPLDVKKALSFPQNQYMDNLMFAAVNTNEAFGRVFLVTVKQETFFYLLAFAKPIIPLILRQDFDKILAFDYVPSYGDQKAQVLIRIKFKDWQKYKIGAAMKMVLNEKKGAYEASYFGPLEYTRSGRIFGPLRPEFMGRS